MKLPHHVDTPPPLLRQEQFGPLDSSSMVHASHLKHEKLIHLGRVNQNPRPVLNINLLPKKKESSIS